MSAAPRKTMTAEAYLASERVSEQKHEYLNGEVFLMAGASRNHNRIAAEPNVRRPNLAFANSA